MMGVRTLLGNLPTGNGLFWLGLVLRLALLVFAVPLTYSEWFLPFLTQAIETGPLTPWASNLAAGTAMEAFPYGVLMYLIALPFTALGHGFSLLTGVAGGAGFGLGLTVLMADLLLFSLLRNLRPGHLHRVLVLYWLSPIVIYVLYWHGQLDVFPVFLLAMSLVFVLRQNAILAGSFVAMAVATKLSMAIALPVILLYLGMSKRRRRYLKPFAAAAVLGTFLLYLPILWSASARSMVFGTPQIEKIYDFSVNLTDVASLYLTPVVYCLTLFAIWQLRRINLHLMTALLGLVFMAVVMMTPASPGWYLWFVPFLVINLVNSPKRFLTFVYGYGALFVVFQLLQSSGASVPVLGLKLTAPLAERYAIETTFTSLLLSVLFAAGLVLCFLMVRESVIRNDFFRFTRKPLFVSIAGDSGSGKDTLAEAIMDVLGRETATHISGDDYHNWDRHKPMWQVLTHLNPKANDLLRLKQDLLDLRSGKTIRNRHYDHTVGRMTKLRSVDANDVLIASGLHALYDAELTDVSDVRVFLDMDDDLRHFFKIQRDVFVRGHTLEQVLEKIAQREEDRNRFIQPQSKNADIVFTLQALNKASIRTDEAVEGKPHLKLQVRLSQGTPYDRLVRVLVSLCGAHVEVSATHQDAPVEVTLEGELDAEDIALAGRELRQTLDELMTYDPVWQGGMLGLMQLFTLNQVAYALKRRAQ